ncbi:MAG: hypothetical protein KA270_02910 [Saprospiraceae bacterium]|nr:hypothetical protein [Saprospiraceae bacterium]
MNREKYPVYIMLQDYEGFLAGKPVILVGFELSTMTDKSPFYGKDGEIIRIPNKLVTKA